MEKTPKFFDKKISRRDFLKKSFFMTLAVLFGLKTIKDNKEISNLRQEIEEKEKELKEKQLMYEKVKKDLEEIIENSQKNIEYLKTLEVVATAYTSGPESTGKMPGRKDYGITYSGLPALKGTVAVDPEIIPLGTVLEIPDYGYAIALDTGSAVKGNKIDVYFDNVDEAIKWGVKKLKVRILGRIENFPHIKY
ncbi:MAG: hypothetical protein KatS3mg094_072 [Candidatus Parcubacteria bacterium]|nr:MAG: hypothetical protein KatS3mg094_072 [Candidatus Parcubacteria bacterium]